ncbi:MAG: DNA recombination protein RmuC, partial [Acidimicrobiales bacterium]
VLALAGDRLGQHAAAGSHELDLRSQAIGRQLTDMGTELHRVTDLVSALQRQRAEQHGQLVQGLTKATQITAQLAETTQHLRDALASPKARGQWGERMADDVLRTAGFVEGLNYRRQKAIAGGTVPDFTFLLPNGLFLHMDVKFPVDNYLRFLEASSDVERERRCAGFLRDVRDRLKELAKRGYDDPTTTPGYLLLFIPNESIYGFIHEHDPGLADAALAQRVVLCSPFTLFAVLGVIRQAVDSFMLERASDEILQALGAFGAQWQKFSDQLDVVGTRLVSTQRAYDALAGTRRRQLERQLDAIDAIRTRRHLAADAGAGGEVEEGGGPVAELRVVR